MNFIGKLPSIYDNIFVDFNSDGTITATDKKDEEYVKEINKVLNALKKEIQPLIEYISKNIFKNKKIFSQELVINKEKNILALCDLSSKNTVLEIKTNYSLNIEQFKEQLYYESNGRDCYILQIDWFDIKNGIKFIISKVELFEKEENFRDLIKRKNDFQRKINNDNIKQHVIRVEKNIEDIPDKEKQKYIKYAMKILEKSNGKIGALTYTNSKENVEALCLECGYKWKIRADHLLERCKCPNCINIK